MADSSRLETHHPRWVTFPAVFAVEHALYRLTMEQSKAASVESFVPCDAEWAALSAVGEFPHRPVAVIGFKPFQQFLKKRVGSQCGAVTDDDESAAGPGESHVHAAGIR